MEKVEQEYEGMKQDFEKLRAVIGDLADVLDEEFKNYVVEEDKTLQFKQMIVQQSNEKAKAQEVTQ